MLGFVSRTGSFLTPTTPNRISRAHRLIFGIYLFIFLYVYSLGDVVSRRTVAGLGHDVFGGQKQRSGMRRRPWWIEQSSTTLIRQQ